MGLSRRRLGRIGRADRILREGLVQFSGFGKQLAWARRSCEEGGSGGCGDERVRFVGPHQGFLYENVVLHTLNGLFSPYAVWLPNCARIRGDQSKTDEMAQSRMKACQWRGRHDPIYNDQQDRSGRILS